MVMFQKMRELRGRPLRYLVTAACCQGFLLYGYDQGVMSGLIGADNQFGKQFHHPSSNMQGTITSIYDIGCCVGTLICLYVGDKTGRKNLVMGGSLILVLGAILLGSSTTLAQLILGRIVTGIGNGINTSIVPMYQAEMSKPENRGRLCYLQSAMLTFGMVIAYWLDFGMSYTDNSAQWRLPLAFQGFFGVTIVLSLMFLPDTPRYLVQKGRPTEAAEVLARLDGGDTTKDSPTVVFIRRQIETAIELESAGGPFRYRELLKGGKLQNFRRLFLGSWLMVMVQFTGATTISYYAPIIYQKTMGLSRHLSLIMGGATTTCYFAGSWIPVFTVEKFGRRFLLMFSAVGMCMCFTLVAILLGVGTKTASYGAIAMVFLFQIFLACGFLGVPQFYTAEISTTRIRARAVSIAGFWHWMAIYIVVQITPHAVATMGWKVFILWASLCALWVPIVYCFYPETTGLQLEDVDHIFEQGGITGGVFTSKGGRTVQPGHHSKAPNLEGVETGILINPSAQTKEAFLLEKGIVHHREVAK